MRFKPGNRILNKSLIVLTLIVVVLVIFLGIPKNCGSNEECFNLKASNCKKVKAVLVKDKNEISYKILGKTKEDCIAKVTMQKVSDKYPMEVKEVLEKKSMDCNIPRSLIQEKGITGISNIYDYCTGPLKEAFLDITLQKLYEVVVKNIGTLTSGLQQVLNQTAWK